MLQEVRRVWVWVGWGWGKVGEGGRVFNFIAEVYCRGRHKTTVPVCCVLTATRFFLVRGGSSSWLDQAGAGVTSCAARSFAGVSCGTSLCCSEGACSRPGCARACAALEQKLFSPSAAVGAVCRCALVGWEQRLPGTWRCGCKPVRRLPRRRPCPASSQPPAGRPALHAEAPLQGPQRRAVGAGRRPRSACVCVPACPGAVQVPPWIEQGPPKRRPSPALARHWLCTRQGFVGEASASSGGPAPLSSLGLQTPGLQRGPLPPWLGGSSRRAACPAAWAGPGPTPASSPGRTTSHSTLKAAPVCCQRLGSEVAAASAGGQAHRRLGGRVLPM